ncbi:F-box only protein 47-like [Sphaeramia orbicularis]|uniref:F-box only protein 47-like n=1 Tax=Sphaeramia orbicularis TaxID=375764 RepID=UPI00117F245A|nr:F-box only protein 47 [Sphaeramia orbicularis]
MAKMKKTPRNVGQYSLKHMPQQYKRTRRPLSARTIMTRSMLTLSSNSSTTGFFYRLPMEVIDIILRQLSVLEMSVLGMVSKDLTGYVVDHISSLVWKNKMITQNFHHTNSNEVKSTIQHYRALGLLFKRCTLLLPTKDRLKFIFNNFSQISCFMLEQCLVPNCSGFSSFGVFLQTVIAGWNELECHRVFNFLCDHTNLLQKIATVISRKPGLLSYRELQIRLFCRQVLLDPWLNRPECQFWLIELLKPWPMVSQAHLLLILYGPLLPEGTIGWHDLVDRVVPHGHLWELAKSILLLLARFQVKDWTTDSILPILEELTVIPEPWNMENVARLLVLCGNHLCYTFLANKALNGRLHDISRLIVFIIMVCEKDGYHMNWAVRLVHQIYQVFTTAVEKLYFIQSLEGMFSKITREFFELPVTGEIQERETFQMLCVLLDSSARFHAKFLHMFLKDE